MGQGASCKAHGLRRRGGLLDISWELFSIGQGALGIRAKGEVRVAYCGDWAERIAEEKEGIVGSSNKVSGVRFQPALSFGSQPTPWRV